MRCIRSAAALDELQAFRPSAVLAFDRELRFHQRQRRRPPVQAGSEARGQEKVAALDRPLAIQLVQGDRDRAGRGVAVALQVLEDGIAVEPEHVAGGVNDPNVGLMRDEPADVAHLAVGVGEHGEGGIGQDPHRPLEDGSAVHRQVMKALLEGRGGRRNPAAAGRPAREVAAGAIRAELVGHQSLIRFARRQQDRAGAVAEQREALLVVGIDDPAVAVSADDQGALAVARRNELGRDDQGEDEARARRLDVERGTGQLEPVLDQVGRGRETPCRA